MSRYFIQQNDRGDLLWLNPATQRPEYVTEENAKKYRLVPLYVEVPEPAVMDERSAITPEMRERIRRAELDAKEHLENGIWGVKDAISDLRWNRKSTAMIRDVLGPILRDLLGEQDD